MSSKIPQFVIGIGKPHKEINHKDNTYPKLERHICVILQEIFFIECFDRHEYNQQNRQN